MIVLSAAPEAITVADDGTPLYSDAESVLEEFMGAGMPMSRLRWHYRSAHESLISFSNVTFYDAAYHALDAQLREALTVGRPIEAA